jgi:peptidoglycan/xylan/chitin deacetylase (PgdA/CDA1 family)
MRVTVGEKEGKLGAAARCTMLALIMKLISRVLLFTLLGVSLGSCTSNKKDVAATSTAPAEPAKTVANTKYRTPTVKGPVPRNPDMNLPSNFGAGSGVTVSRGSTAFPYVAMTFDDGPHPQNTPRLLDMLRARNIKATFYVIGRNVDMYPAVVRRVVAEGHEIGNHTYTHRLLTKLSDDEVLRELSRTRDAIARAAGVQPRTLRPPYGALAQRQRELVHSQFGYPTVLWSVDPRDWQRPGPSVVTSRILAGSGNGAVVLAHDLHAPTVDAMPATLDGLLRRGFKFVTVSQLIAQSGSSATAVPAVAKAPEPAAPAVPEPATVSGGPEESLLATP